MSQTTYTVSDLNRLFAILANLTGTIGADTDSRISAGVLWLTGAGAPVDYTDGDPAATGEGIAEIGSLYSDTTAGVLYINTGTKAHQTWTKVGTQT